MRSPARHLLVFLLPLSVIVTGSDEVQAQEIRTVGVDSLRIAVRTGAFFDGQSRDFLNSALSEHSERGLFETVRASLGGYLYHPQLATWRARGKLTFKQRRMASNGMLTSNRVNETIPEYGVDLEFLRRHPLSGHVGASQVVSFVYPNYRSSFNVQRRNVNGGFSWRYRGLTQLLNAASDQYRSEDTINTEENRSNIRYEARQQNARLRNMLQLQFLRTQQGTTGNDFETQSARLTSNVSMDRAGVRNLNFMAYQYRQLSRNDTENQEATLWTQQPLPHGFACQGSATRRVNTSGDVRTRTNAGSVSLTQQLYQSLTTTLSLDASHPVFGGGEQSDYWRELMLQYRKSTFFGSLGLYGEAGRRTFREDIADPVRYLQVEDFVASYSLAFAITDTRADLATLEVRDLTRPELILIEGLDYQVTARPDVIEVSILPAGSVVEGDQMRLSYYITMDASYGFSEDQASYGANISLGRHLHLSAMKSRADRDLDYGNPEFLLTYSRGTRLAARLTLADLELRGDYDESIGSANSYLRRLYGARYTHPLHRTLNLMIDGSYAETDYFDGDGISRVWAAQGGCWWYPGRNAVFESRLEFVDRRGRRDDGHDVRWTSRFGYRTPLFQFSVDHVHLSRLLEAIGREQRDVVTASIQRDF